VEEIPRPRPPDLGSPAAGRKDRARACESKLTRGLTRRARWVWVVFAIVSRAEGGNCETRWAISEAVREWFISRAVMCRLAWGIVQRAVWG